MARSIHTQKLARKQQQRLARTSLAKRQKAQVMSDGLYANIHKKRKRIKAQKKAGKKTERMRSVGSKGAPTSKAFKKAAKTAKRATYE